MRPSLVAEVIRVCITNRRPLLLWGPPGVCKSDLVRQGADQLHRELVDPRPAQIDPVDLRGLPRFQGDFTHWAPPGFLPRGDSTAVLFLDELAQAPTMVQNACLQLILDRAVGEYRLPDGVAVIAAANRQADRAGASRITTALANRFYTHIEIDVSNEDWQSWALEAGVPAVVRNFLKFRPTLLHDFNPEDADACRSFPTPRTWQRVGEQVTDFDGHPQRDALLVDTVAGCVGRGAGAEFCAFDRIWMHLPKPADVLAKPDTADVPESLDVLYALAGALAEAVRGDKGAKWAGPLLTYAKRMPAEFEVSTIRDAWAINPTIQNLPDVQRWVAHHRELILGA